MQRGPGVCNCKQPCRGMGSPLTPPHHNTHSAGCRLAAQLESCTTVPGHPHLPTQPADATLTGLIAAVSLLSSVVAGMLAQGSAPAAA